MRASIGQVVLLGGVVAAADLAEADALTQRSASTMKSRFSGWKPMSGSGFDVWLKIDTGMNRLGFATSEAIVRSRGCKPAIPSRLCAS